MPAATVHDPDLIPAISAGCAAAVLDALLDEFPDLAQGNDVSVLFLQRPGPHIRDRDMEFLRDQVQFQFVRDLYSEGAEDRM